MKTKAKPDVAVEAAKLLRAVPEVAIDREWIKEKLMVGTDAEANYFVRFGRQHARLVKRYRDAHFGEDDLGAVCSEVTGCCAIGFVEIAVACANGFDLPVDLLAKDLLAEALVELGWAEPVLKSAYGNLVDGDYPPSESFEEWKEVIHGNWDEIGEEGLVPAWNDHHCEGKEQVLELAAKAAELADRLAADG